MKKSVKIVMLPTIDKTDIRYNSSLKLFSSKISDCGVDNNDYISCQHLYVTISQEDGPIKLYDYCLLFDFFGKLMTDTPQQWLGNGTLNDGLRKVIATTNSKIKIPYRINGHSGLRQREVNGVLQVKQLPQLQQSTVKEYVANHEGEFEVEYETFQDNPNKFKFEAKAKPNFEYWVTPKLKLNQDNTVNINSVDVKIILSRQKLKNILHCATGNVRDFVMHEDSFIDDWIKENL